MSSTLFRRADRLAAWIPIQGGYSSNEVALEEVRKLGLSGEFRAIRDSSPRPGVSDKPQLTIPSTRAKPAAGYIPRDEQRSPIEERIYQRFR